MSRPEFVATFQSMQERLAAALADIDPAAKLCRDEWIRPDLRQGEGGGGRSIVFSDGPVIEKGGVNFSNVRGFLSKEMSRALLGRDEEIEFTATGTSVVIHPRNPMAPTVHANVRYFEAAGSTWFGGGTDLTPYYLFTDDARDFHAGLKSICDRHDAAHYPRFKKWCDEYFYLPHRNEARGIGGIFFDYLGREGEKKADTFAPFVTDLAVGFQEVYLPILQRRLNLEYGAHERHFQLLRRGRYVEFNLLYDRGTYFGLKSAGRTESILMSLPAEVRWEYCADPEPETREGELVAALKAPRSWI